MRIHAIPNMVVCFELLIKKNKHIVNIVFCPTLHFVHPKTKIKEVLFTDMLFSDITVSI